MILIDTEQLISLVQVLESAMNDIDSAAESLRQITTHANWGCPERYRINESILSNRTQMQNLQARAGDFYRTAKQVAQEFTDTENGISGMFTRLESALANALTTGMDIGGKSAAGLWQEGQLGAVRSVGEILADIIRSKRTPAPVIIPKINWEEQGWADKLPYNGRVPGMVLIDDVLADMSRKVAAVSLDAFGS